MPPTLTLKESRDKPVRQRHPWVFSGAVERLRGDAQPGDLVTVADHRGAPLATALMALAVWPLRGWPLAIPVAVGAVVYAGAALLLDIVPASDRVYWREVVRRC